MNVFEIPTELLVATRKGMVIPAHPLALTADRQLDEDRQSALVKYYIDAGAGGIAIGVHTTQFEIRDPAVGLFERVLSLVSETIDECCSAEQRKILKIAGVCGTTSQAMDEAQFARTHGYHAALLSLAAFRGIDDRAVLAHCRQVASIIPLVGFYLQPAVGGRELSYSFWREFVEIENVLAIKIAPFNRYQTMDVVRAVCEADRVNDIALYTGNDDNIIGDLLTEYEFSTALGTRKARIVGGLLGQWAVWTKTAVELLSTIHNAVATGNISTDLLTLNAKLTDANAAIFDSANNFAGCIPGIHEVLRRQGLLDNLHCINPNEKLSPGQLQEIDRVCSAYPELVDDEFVQSNLRIWMAKN